MSFTPKQAYALSKGYTDQSIEGTSGVLAGKNCQISSIEQMEGGTRVTFSWYKDGETEARVDSIFVPDGAKGDKGDSGQKGDTGEKGDEGFSPEITVVEQTATTYKLKIVTEDSEFITPNLKGGGSGGLDVGVIDESLVFTY